MLRSAQHDMLPEAMCHLFWLHNNWSMLNSHKRKAKRTGRSNQKLQPGRNYMFVLRIGLGRSKRLILNHIFRAVTALILMSGAAHAGDGEDLLKAAFTGDLAQVRTLLEKGADIDHQNRDGVTALILSSQQGHGWIVQALLARGAEIDIQDWLGSTALMHASGEGYEGVVQALLARGAEIDIQNRVGWTALIQAS